MIGRRPLWLAFGVVLLILCGMAGSTVYHGLTTGCVKARYGYHCQAVVPVRYAITMVLTGLGCLVLAAGTVLGFGMAFTRRR